MLLVQGPWFKNTKLKVPESHVEIQQEASCSPNLFVNIVKGSEA